MENLPHFELVPHVGFGPIRLGMARPELHAAMKAAGFPHAHGDGDGGLDFFGAENAIQVEYSGTTASFIGVSNGDHFTCSIYGVDPFDTSAPELFALLAKHANEQSVYNIHEALFRSTIVALYDADEQYDRKGGESRVMWAQIGIGDARYLAAMDAINAR